MALFGSRMKGWTPPINPQLGMDIAREQGIMPGDQPPVQMPTPPLPQRKGFNAPGGWAERLYAIGGTLRDDDGGRSAANYFALQQHRADQAERMRQASLGRETEWQDWLRKKEWERANPAPTTNDTVADYEFIRQQLGDEWGEKFLRNRADPPRYVQGPDGQFYPVQTAQTPMRPVGKLTPIDGGPASAPGNFPLGQ